MTKIAFIGAGSLGFTRSLVRDALSFPLLQEATLALMDIDAERLEFARRSVQRIVAEGDYPARVEATLDRAEALRDADFVLITILASPLDVWRNDIEIPKRYGVDTNIGDTRGLSGIFRALRTIPVMLDIARDVDRYCPAAYVLNYTNPMAMLCRALEMETGVRLVGLCHSVQETSAMLARWIGAPLEEVTYTCAGINHEAWFLDFRWKGADAYPLIHEAVASRAEVYNEEQVRSELFLALGYYVTESSGHNSEYNWWFRKRPDLIDAYCTHGTGWNPGIYARNVTEYEKRAGDWRDRLQRWFDEPLGLARGSEYASYIMNALRGGEPFQFNGNVANTELISNLPAGACVEVPIWASKNGLEPVRVGGLPAPVAMLTRLNSEIEEMAVEGALEGDPTKIYRAIAHDPLTASVLSLREIRQMVNEMFAANRDHLPTFTRYEA
jgi:alpha-galactosidase